MAVTTARVYFAFNVGLTGAFAYSALTLLVGRRSSFANVKIQEHAASKGRSTSRLTIPRMAEWSDVIKTIRPVKIE